MPQRIIEWFKKPLEAVDLGHKVWDAILWIAAAILPIAGPRLGIQSPTLTTWIAVGSGLGGLLGYYATVIRFSGEGRHRCTTQSARNLRWAFAPLILVVLMLCVLRPEAQQYLKYAQPIRETLVDLPLLANVGGLLCALWLVARIIGGITLLSPKLWNAKL